MASRTLVIAVSRRPGYETNDYVGYDREVRRETMAGRQGADIGRPRGAAARVAGHGPDAATRQAWAELAEISDAEFRAMKLRMLELQAS